MTTTVQPAQSPVRASRRAAPPGPDARIVRLLHSTGTLSEADCLWLLSTDQVGRISYTTGALPAVAPVTYAVAGLDILIRTEPDQRLSDIVRENVITLQVDRVDRDQLIGWQGTATGIARPVPFLGHDGRTLCLTSMIISGRRVLLR